MSHPPRRPKQRSLPEHTTDLRLDRRLIQRRGWIERATLERELAGLADAAHKVAPPEEAEEPRPDGGEETGGTGAPGAPGETTPQNTP